MVRLSFDGVRSVAPGAQVRPTLFDNAHSGPADACIVGQQVQPDFAEVNCRRGEKTCIPPTSIAPHV